MMRLQFLLILLVLVYSQFLIFSLGATTTSVTVDITNNQNHNNFNNHDPTFQTQGYEPVQSVPDALPSVKPEAEIDSSRSCPGSCQDINSCEGTVLHGRCPGGADNICCVEGSSGGFSPSPSESFGFEQPRRAPRRSPSRNRCPGQCGSPDECEGTIRHGLCPGGSDNVCCVSNGGNEQQDQDQNQEERQPRRTARRRQEDDSGDNGDQQQQSPSADIERGSGATASCRGIDRSRCASGSQVSISVPVNTFSGGQSSMRVQVHRCMANEVKEIFQQILQTGFKIHSLGGYACRGNTSNRGVLSNHAFGIAIDINPNENPYVRGSQVVGSRAYINRGSVAGRPGVIEANSEIVQIFTQRGYRWGGNYRGLKDYMHFEKMN